MGVYVGQNGGKKINIEMKNTYQEDWAERSLFYNCRMFTEGLKTGQSYSSKFQFHVIELSNYLNIIKRNHVLATVRTRLHLASGLLTHDFFL